MCVCGGGGRCVLVCVCVCVRVSFFCGKRGRGLFMGVGGFVCDRFVSVWVGVCVCVAGRGERC